MVKEYFNASAAMAGTTKIAFLIRGILTILFGILLVTHPLDVMYFLCSATGLLFLICGGWTLLSLALAQKERRIFWGIYGVAMLIFGFVLLVHLGFAQRVVGYLIAFWFLANGFMSFWDTARKEAPFSGKAIPLVSSLITIMVGVMLFSWPLMGLSGMFWVAGLILIVNGIMLLSFASILHRFELLHRKAAETIDAEVVSAENEVRK